MAPHSPKALAITFLLLCVVAFALVSAHKAHDHGKDHEGRGCPHLHASEKGHHDHHHHHHDNDEKHHVHGRVDHHHHHEDSSPHHHDHDHEHSVKDHAHHHHTHDEHAIASENAASAVSRALMASFMVSLLSFSGALLSLRISRDIIIFTSALAVGCLLSDPFLHLLPHLFESQHHHHHDHHDHDAPHSHGSEGLWIMGGFIFCLLVELILSNFNIGHHHHHHDTDEDGDSKGSGNAALPASRGIKTFGWLNLVSDGVHNFVDGVGMGVAFLSGLRPGLATTLSIVFHELPQELSDFGLLMAAGFSPLQALTANFCSGLLAMAGALVGAWGGALGSEVEGAMVGVTVGSFVYISCVDILPELKEMAGKSKARQLEIIVGVVCGVAVMYVLGMYESRIASLVG